jgi:hypothetical protein
MRPSLVLNLISAGLALAGAFLICHPAQAQVRGGGMGGQSFGGGGFSGGMSGGGFSGGLSGSGSGSGFRTSGLSTQLNRGGGFAGNNPFDPFASTRGTPLTFGGTSYTGSAGISGGNIGGNFGLYGGGTMAGNRGMLGGGQLGGMNGRSGMGTGVKLATSTMGAALKAIPPAASEVLPRLDKILADSAPNGSRDIQMEIDGSTLVLKGTVSSEREKQLAEAMLRLEPGVYDIRNDLEVRRTALPVPKKAPPPPPKPRP